MDSPLTPRVSDLADENSPFKGTHNRHEYRPEVWHSDTTVRDGASAARTDLFALRDHFRWSR
jgi:hypothetical protein